MKLGRKKHYETTAYINREQGIKSEQTSRCEALKVLGRGPKTLRTAIKSEIRAVGKLVTPRKNNGWHYTPAIFVNLPCQKCLILRF